MRENEPRQRVGELKALARALRPYRRFPEVRVELATIWKEIDQMELLGLTE